jgi:ABC-type polysaccharide/polyol phosphate export permease
MRLQAPWVHSLGPLVLADLRRRYAGSLLGASWAVLAPLIEAATYGIVFGLVLGIAGRTTLPYAVLIASGLFPWASLREALEGSASVLADNRWVRRSRVPVELLVARLVLATLVRASISLIVVYGFAIVQRTRPSVLDCLGPFAAIALQALLAYGLGLCIAPLTTLLPDLRPTLVSLLTVLTFASPILYPESLAKGALAIVLQCNPFTHLLRLYRAPAEPLTAEAWAISLAVAGGAALAAWGLGRAVRARLWWSARDAL